MQVFRDVYGANEAKDGSFGMKAAFRRRVRKVENSAPSRANESAPRCRGAMAARVPLPFAVAAAICSSGWAPGALDAGMPMF